MTRSLGELNAIVSDGFNGALGLHVTVCGPAKGTRSAEWTLAPTRLDSGGPAHHGAISSVIETIASIAGTTVESSADAILGVSNNTDYDEPSSRSPFHVLATLLTQNPQQQLWDVAVSHTRGNAVARGRVRLKVQTR